MQSECGLNDVQLKIMLKAYIYIGGVVWCGVVWCVCVCVCVCVNECGKRKPLVIFHESVRRDHSQWAQRWNCTEPKRSATLRSEESDTFLDFSQIKSNSDFRRSVTIGQINATVGRSLLLMSLVFASCLSVNGKSLLTAS